MSNQEHVTEATLHLSNKKYTATRLNLIVTQDYDQHTGYAKGLVYGGLMDLDVKDPREPDFFKAMIDPTKKIQGNVSLMAGTKLINDIKFENAAIVGYTLSWSRDNDPLVTLKVIAAKVTVDGVAFNR